MSVIIVQLYHESLTDIDVNELIQIFQGLSSVSSFEFFSYNVLAI